VTSAARVAWQEQTVASLGAGAIGAAAGGVADAWPASVPKAVR
jgi:hypothetical protein